MELLNLVTTVISFLTFLLVAYDKARSCFLKATLNGQPFSVPKDELKEAYRRAALAEASRLAGGRRVNLKVEYRGYTLEVTSDELK